MIFKINKYLTRLVVLIILASCSTTFKNLNLNSAESLQEDSPKDFQEIYDYQSYFYNDLEIIQATIDNEMLDQKALNDAKILKKNYQKILTKKNSDTKTSGREGEGGRVLGLVTTCMRAQPLLFLRHARAAGCKRR